MKTKDKDYELFKMAVYWNLVPALKILRKLKRNQVQKIANQASEISEREPLHLTSQQFVIADVKEKPLTGVHIVALMVAGLWILCNEDESIAGALLNDWSDLPLFSLLSLSDGEE